MMRKTSAISTLDLGKYREIIIAVALFLLFDLSVLVLNFYTSYQISEDASAINLAGRQRMLSQRSTKAIYAVQERVLAGAPSGDDAKELDSAVRLFDESLRAFKSGGTVMGTDGKLVALHAVQPGKALDAVNAAALLWSPFVEKTQAALQSGAAMDTVRGAATYARDNNTALLGHMNALTSALEGDAAQRAANLRLVQTVGIALALLNFVFILLKFIRRLRASDAVAEAIAQENREILGSVNEGLFLVTPDMRIGSQIAKSSHALFGKQVKAGESFLELLRPLVNEKTMQDAQDYMGLLFTKHVKEALVQGINPLGEVQVTARNRLGTESLRHLSFGFYRSHTDSGIGHLLVTIQDVSEKKALLTQLEQERSRASKEFSMLVNAVEIDPTVLRQFVERSEMQLLTVNDLLRSISSNSSDKQVKSSIDSAFRSIHAFKGDASMLGLQTLAHQAHAFETSLQALRDSAEVTGSRLLELPLPLDDLMSKVAAFKEISKRRYSSNLPTAPASLGPSLEQLAQKIASDCHKNIATHIDVAAMHGLTPLQHTVVQEVAVQLLRNAIVHGIESAAERKALSKPAVGQIQLSVMQEAGKEWVLTVRDDGAGLNPSKIKDRLVALGWYDEAALDSFSERQIMGHIFRAGFSTAETTQEKALHAGRGVGLDMVQSHAKSLGGRILVSCQLGVYAQFQMRFSA